MDTKTMLTTTEILKFVEKAQSLGIYPTMSGVLKAYETLDIYEKDSWGRLDNGIEIAINELETSIKLFLQD